MIKLLLASTLMLVAIVAQTQSLPVRLSVVSITPSENTGQDYSPWLSDDITNLVQSAWSDNAKWVQVTLKLEKKSLVSSLSLYDHEGSFSDKPALLYAMNGTQRVLIGSFDGSAYKSWVTLKPFQALVADAIMIYKYGNNIPQKINVFGQPITESTSIPRPLDLLKLVSAKDNPVTGADYSAYLNNDMNKLVPSYWQPENFKWTDVTIKFDKKSLLTKLDLYDTEGSFESAPAQVYALNGKEKTLIGTFTGDSYYEFKSYALTEPLVAEGIIIHKYCNNIPVKIRAYGKVLPTDPLDAILYAQERVNVTNVTSNLPTPQNYSPYLNDDMGSLVQTDWSGDNCRWMDLTLKLDIKSTLTKLELYDGEDEFSSTPAQIYALNGTKKTLLGTFTGPAYKVWQTLTFPSVVAEAIVIHKYCNALPIKIRVYGHPVEEATVTPPVVSLGNKIPIDASRWYQLNNTSGGLASLFDGNTNDELQSGWGKVLNTYDAYYPLQAGESMDIKAVKFYDGNGSNSASPMKLSIITSDWKRIELAQFQGLEYNAWVGPYPTRSTSGDAKFLLDNVVTGARYLVINTSDFWPREIELYGTYQAGNVAASGVPKKSPTFKKLLGVNAFEWDFYQSNVPGISAPKLKALQSFGVIRHYMDWEKLELTEGNYTFNPTHSGGWNYDLMYERCKADGIEVMACLKDMTPWMNSTYPADQQGSDNVPVRFGKDYANPLSYIEQAKVAFQYAARYGKNPSINPALVKVNTNARWANDPANVVKIGLGLINFIECDNERDKWWRGRKAYQTGREYAANMSAFYDGHKNTMGEGVGVKNADPSMTVVMGGLCSIANGTDYIRGMIDWCKEFRGYKSDGRVDLCWDVINYHLYPDNGQSMQNGNGASSRGKAPELSVAAQVVRNVLKLAHEACYDMPVYVSETGYDLNQGSPLHAISIGNKSVTTTQADWNLRTALLYGREGVDRVDFYQTYDLNLDCANQFCSMGFMNADFTRKPAANYFYQAKKLIGDYVFKESLSTNPNVDRYESNGQSAYALWIPDEVGRTGQYTLNLGVGTAAKVYTPQTGCDSMAIQVLPVINGQLALTLTETPIFVIPASISARLAAQSPENEEELLRVYPNPSADKVSVQLRSAYVGDVEISIADANLGITRHQITRPKSTTTFSEMVDLSALPYGIYLLEVKQGTTRTVRRILKVH
ncbi:T9SS type A sorting domain-containing protein [Spirosoma sp. KCTC 42546]|uniref:T9SS type A sorting domain-containing protein n=1 Tax=Spirosoma sp. KCTC 42546 TaxID=2520506 RepID=UPI00115C1B8E|nr:T9SS type A sorting domain-containing protein [Spirosoma sp. KCTC 42546]QDK77071.1 T9SS type A sorting domain-containing protein [Spirosoma sp. KCTC 42546]